LFLYLGFSDLGDSHEVSQEASFSYISLIVASSNSPSKFENWADTCNKLCQLTVFHELLEKILFLFNEPVPLFLLLLHHVAFSQNPTFFEFLLTWLLIFQIIEGVAEWIIGSIWIYII